VGMHRQMELLDDKGGRIIVRGGFRAGLGLGRGKETCSMHIYNSSVGKGMGMEVLRL
jgi:hypothetical protein